jgi:hypothetical protein
VSKLKDPACLFFISNWLLSTAEMDARTRGWYLNLILHNYDKGSIPADTMELAHLAGVRFDEFELFLEMYKNVISHKFKPIPGTDRLENPTAADILKSRELFKEKRVKSGNIGVITKMAKKFVGFSKFESKLKNDLSAFTDDQLEYYKNYDNLKVLIDSYLVPVNNDIDISFVDPKYIETFEAWLKHKKGRGERYKTADSLQQCYKKLLKDSGNDPDIAKEIIDFARGNNYAGFFPQKHKIYQAPSVTQPLGKADGLLRQNKAIKMTFTDEE